VKLLGDRLRRVFVGQRLLLCLLGDALREVADCGEVVVSDGVVDEERVDAGIESRRRGFRPDGDQASFTRVPRLGAAHGIPTLPNLHQDIPQQRLLILCRGARHVILLHQSDELRFSIRRDGAVLCLAPGALGEALPEYLEDLRKIGPNGSFQLLISLVPAQIEFEVEGSGAGVCHCDDFEEPLAAAREETLPQALARSSERFRSQGPPDLACNVCLWRCVWGLTMLPSCHDRDPRLAAPSRVR